MDPHQHGLERKTDSSNMYILTHSEVKISEHIWTIQIRYSNGSSFLPSDDFVFTS